MNIRFAKTEDIPQILCVMDKAREFMVASGNPNQWKPGYPTAAMIEKDIASDHFYVIEDEGRICGCFAFIVGADPTYAYIEGGSWLSEETYGTIHRIASDQTVHGLFTTVLDFCAAKCPHIRIDTHQDNKVMQKLIERNGFSYRGIIYIADGSPRLAYERMGEVTA